MNRGQLSTTEPKHPTRPLHVRKRKRRGMQTSRRVETTRVTSAQAGNPITAIEFPTDGVSRLRRIVTRSRARGTGKYPSWKAKRMLQWESPHELNVFRILDADPSVLTFSEQPARITYVLHGEERKHYPDLLVHWAGAKEFWEIKPRAEAAESAVVQRTALLEAALPAYGYGYRLVLADEIAGLPALQNALTLLRFGRANVDIVARERIYRLLRAPGSVTWGAVIGGLFGPTGRAQVSRLVLEGVVTFDRSKPLSDDTVLALSEVRAQLKEAA